MTGSSLSGGARHMPWKRPFDITLSLGALVLSAPAWAIIAGLIKVDSKGPVLFKQERIGRERRAFTMYKFRTMVYRDPATIDQLREPVVTSSRDPRITRVGRLLRVTSLDELPQLINVLRGEMSLVGPRPVLPDQAKAVPVDYSDRFAALPGITGLAQVRGRRSLDWLQQLETEVEYVQTASLFLDLKILGGTVLQIFQGKGVYADETKNWRHFLTSMESNTN